MAEEDGSPQIRIYKYSSSKDAPHSTYKIIKYPGELQETALFNSEYCHNIIKVYENGNVLI